MRALRTAAAITLAGVFFSTSLRAADAPAVDALRAARIATDYLVELGAKAPHIVSITLEKSALLRGKSSWVVRWSCPVEADGLREVGLRVNLDGSSARLVEDKSAAARREAKRAKPF